HRDFCAQRRYTLRYLGLKAREEHHTGFGEGLLNVSVFIQRQARHEHLTVNDWKAFWREVDIDLYFDSIRMDLDEDDNHHHHHNHDHDCNRRHDKERNDRNDQLYLARGRKRRGVISSEGSGNGQNNEDLAEGLHREVERQRLRQFRIQRNIREHALPPVQTVTGAPSKYIPIEEAVNRLPLLSEDPERQVEIKTSRHKQQETQAQKTSEELEKAKIQPSINTMVLHQLGIGQSPWTIVQLDELFGTASEGPDQSNTKLRSRQPNSRRQKIVSLTQTNPQSQITLQPNQNQCIILNVDIKEIITNPFSVLKGMQHKQTAGEAAQVHHAPRETFSTNGNVRKVASSTDSIVSGQVGVAGTKPIDTQTTSSTLLQGNPIRYI
ncbi:MAG: hypothetical protein EZS28_025430, partial [Streblomastix strix]